MLQIAQEAQLPSTKKKNKNCPRACDVEHDQKAGPWETWDCYIVNLIPKVNAKTKTKIITFSSKLPIARNWLEGDQQTDLIPRANS